MNGIRHNIVFSATAHSLLLAAVLLLGGSSELRKATLFTVSLLDENGRKTAGGHETKGIKQLLPAPANAVSSSSQETASPTLTRTDLPTTPAAASSSVETHAIQPLESSGKGSRAMGAVSSGGTAVSLGTGGTDGETVRGNQSVESAMSDALLKRKIRSALQANLVYPYIARKRNIEGTVFMVFHLDAKGKPEDIRVSRGSNYAILDEAARETVLKTSPFPASNLTIEVPIRFSLRPN